MHLTLSPIVALPGQPETRLHVSDDVITIDGKTYDLSFVAEGTVIQPQTDDDAAGFGSTMDIAWPDDAPFEWPIMRVGGVIRCTIIARLGDTAAPDQRGPWIIENASGDIAIPARRIQTTNDAEREHRSTT